MRQAGHRSERVSDGRDARADAAVPLSAFLRRGLLCSLAVAALACTSTSSSPPVLHAQYQYVASYPLGPFNAGDPLRIVWKPRLVQTTSAATYDVRMCAGVFGPYGNVESLKQASTTAAKVDCPVTSAAVATDVLQAQSTEGSPMEATLTLPSQPGFYNVWQVVISGDDPSRSAMSAAGIIEVRAAAPTLNPSVNVCGSLVRWASDGNTQLARLDVGGVVSEYRLQVGYGTVASTSPGAGIPYLARITGRQVAPDSGSAQATNLMDYNVTRVTSCL